MEVCLLKPKTHRATITDGNIKDEGSLTIASISWRSAGLCLSKESFASYMAGGGRGGGRGGGEVLGAGRGGGWSGVVGGGDGGGISSGGGGLGVGG
jgi:hypothetical protein